MQKCPVGAEVKRRTEAANWDLSPSFLAAGSELVSGSMIVFWRSSPFCTSTGEVEEEARRSEKSNITPRSDFMLPDVWSHCHSVVLLFNLQNEIDQTIITLIRLHKTRTIANNFPTTARSPTKASPSSFATTDGARRQEKGDGRRSCKTDSRTKTALFRRGGGSRVPPLSERK